MQIVNFPPEAMDLFLDQHFLLKEKVFSSEDAQIKKLQTKILSVYSDLHKKLEEKNPHVRMVVGYGGNFKYGVETFLMSYKTFRKQKSMFEYPNNMVSFLPPEFNSFREFVQFADQQRN